MLFGRSLRRDVASSFIATLLVLLTIVLTMLLIRTLGMAANAKLAPQDVALALGYIAMANMPLMLTVSMFIAVVGTLGRMYRDSEMAIWFSSGISLIQFVRPVMALLWPLLLLVAVLSLVLYPWMNQRSDKLRDQFERRSDLSRVTPGQFQTSADGNRVFFVERDSQDKATGSNVFIYGRKDGGESVTTARAGRIEVREDNRYLALSDGQRNEIDTRNNETTLVQFDKYETAVGDRLASATDKPPAKTRATIELMIDGDAISMGELTFRLGLPLAAANMVLLGIGVAASNLRRASNWSLLFALLTFVVYYNLINLSQAWVSNGRASLGNALLAVHGTALLAAVLLLWSKDNPARRSLLGVLTGR